MGRHKKPLLEWSHALDRNTWRIVSDKIRYQSIKTKRRHVHDLSVFEMPHNAHPARTRLNSEAKKPALRRGAFFGMKR